jgi:sterol desaturase/sphingolipid hydroxylase (fatty acid hydroxylase superfamily)
MSIESIIRHLREPFASWGGLVRAATEISSTVTSWHSKTGWPYIASSAVIAYAVYRYGKRQGHFEPEKSFLEAIFPADVYLHRSAIVDYKFVAFDRFARMFLYVPLFSGFTYFLYLAGTWMFGVSSFRVSPAIALWILPIAAVVVMDLSLFAGHWLMHRCSVLWPFHEVHHSAEVLTPVTVFRTHPVEELILGSVHSIFLAIIGALFTSLTDAQLHPFSIFGVNFLMVAFYGFGFQLRHSHVWLSYGPFWSRILISPAQHQVHHSEAERHWNKNYGFIFAVWDLVIGTLYVPKERESIVFGCGADPDDYSTISKMYTTPFVKSYRVIANGAGHGAVTAPPIAASIHRPGLTSRRPTPANRETP